MLDKLSITAIPDKYIHKILVDFGIAEQFDAGRISCASCSTIITWDNLGGIVTQKGSSPILVCNATECIEMVAKNGRS